MSKYFPEPSGADINVTVDLSNYATKADLKNVTLVDTSSFALKTNLATLKPEVAQLEKKVPNVTDFVKKLTEIENKIPDIRNLEKNCINCCRK